MDITIKSNIIDSITTRDTVQVFDKNGEEIDHIRGMTIQVAPNCPTIAYMDVFINPKSIEAQGILSVESLMEAAAFYGLKLIRDEGTNE